MLGRFTEHGGGLTRKGDSHAQATVVNSNTDIVTSGANANGVTIHYAHLMQTAGTGSARFNAGGDRMLDDIINFGNGVIIRDLFIPAGQAINVEAGASTTLAYEISYTVH